MLNRENFHATMSLVTNEKAPNAVFADHLRGIRARPEVLTDLVDESRMGKSQLLYFRRQFERNALDETGASLLVIDPYSEMNFQLWRHRQEQWRCWAPKTAIVNMAKFEECFESCGYATMEQSVSDTAEVVRHIMANNPGMPVLFLPQILDYYPTLAPREFMNDLGARLKAEIPELFVGQRVPYPELVPEDLGTGGGPELTLHFSGPTYWKCAQPAIAGGLLEKVQECDRITLKTHANQLTLPAERKDISLQAHSDSCVPACDAVVLQVKTNLQQYLVIEDPTFERTKELKYRSAAIDLEKYRDYAEYESFVKKSGKGARIRQRNKAARQGYYCKPFHWRMHIPDVHEINTSTEVRSGGEMRSSYLKTVEEMGGAPTRQYKPGTPACPRHWVQPWGVFQPLSGHMQGDQVTDEKLVGYIFLRRFGEFLLYSQILGHYDHLQHGIMILLHHEVMRWTLDSFAPQAAELKAVVYAGYDQGTEGLRDWKRREAFEPFLLIAHD